MAVEARATIESNLGAVRARIAAAAARAGRSPGEIVLVAVTKSVDAEGAREIHRLGVADLGENRVQGLLRKAEAVGPGPRWHLVGTLQRNKVRKALAVADFVHSVDSVALLEAMDRVARETGRVVRAFVEVNVAAEASKHGLAPEQASTLLQEAKRREFVRLVGLMAMAPLDPDPERARPHFRRLRELRDEAVGRGLLPPGAALSMGMTQDFEIAIEEGATIVRVGTALFAGCEAPRRG